MASMSAVLVLVVVAIALVITIVALKIKYNKVSSSNKGCLLCTIMLIC